MQMKHQLLSGPPRLLAVVDQNRCSGCAGSPACITYCDTVSYRKAPVDAISRVKSPDDPFVLAYVELDRCIGCSLCVQICPWDAITMYSREEALELAQELTVVRSDRCATVPPEPPDPPVPQNR